MSFNGRIEAFEILNSEMNYLNTQIDKNKKELDIVKKAIENLTNDMSKYKPSKLSKYSIVRLVQSAYYAVVRLVFNKLFKNIENNLNAKIGEKQPIEDIISAQVARKIAIGHQMSELDFGNEYVAQALETYKLIKNTIANQAAPLVRLGAELKSSASKIDLVSVAKVACAVTGVIAAAAPIAILGISAASPSAANFFFGSQAV